MFTVYWKRCPMAPCVPAGWFLIAEKSGHGGPPVAMTMMGFSWPTLSMSVFTKLSMLNVATSPMWMGAKCSSRVAMHSVSISQLMVSTGCIPKLRQARLAAPIPSKKLRCTTELSWNNSCASCWTRFCPPDPVTSVTIAVLRWVGSRLGPWAALSLIPCFPSIPFSLGC